MIPLSDLNNLYKPDFVAALANIFEHSPWIADRAADTRPYATITHLYDAMASIVANATTEQKLALIKAHPDLADKTARASDLTTESAAEQSALGLDRLSDAEYAAFERANSAYRAKFGFPYIVCVRRHTKDSVLRDFEKRLPNAIASEIEVSILEICRIAALRLDQVVSGDGRLKVHGHLSTHVLDTHSGRPAPGIPLELLELSALGESRVITRTVTNSDGRTDRPLIHDRPLPIGHYELNFRVAAYFSSLKVPMNDPPFLDLIPVRFSISDPESRLHVPLLVTPWSFTTYRGS
jgi:2-oxo-4-hydroxy-4-carboxy-5-ureidoimidazoline decarboxylase